MFLEVAGGVLFAPFVTLLALILILASCGKSFGLRRIYVNLLIRLFEYGRANIESATNQKPSETSGIEVEPVTEKLEVPSLPVENGMVKKLSQNGIANLISKESLALVPEGGDLALQNGHPEGDHITNNNNNQEKSENQESSEETLLFKIEDCLEYLKSGVEAIIEDDVTSRFEAEELKNWNLLTRTNRRYEFISWKLTVIWVIGFLIRYFLLMPLRVTICFVGTLWFVFAFSLVGCIPNERLRRKLNDVATLIGFRLITRSLSAVITLHNEEYRPKNCGFCVANHTSPIDVTILSSDCTYSLVCSLIITTALIGCLPENDFKRRLTMKMLIHCFDFTANSISGLFYYHNTENRPANGICVANHTSPLDVAVLMCDNGYSLIGQRHGGFLGVLQRALSRASPHIWFERAEAKDRMTVASRLRDHVSDPKNPPILIFPEGTCINNTSVMQFKKGSFEVGGVIYPVAIKYDPRFGDAFWNSSRYSMMQYLYLMMTSWAIVCDVWYLPPMYREEGESAIDFANRVKGVIAKQGGLVDLVWDGQLKRMKPKKEWKEKQQEEFTKRLKGD